jgi:hypothetical protein
VYCPDPLKKFGCFLLSAILALAPFDCAAQDTRGTLRAQGTVLVNGSAALPFSTIFPDARIETQKGASALIEVAGSRVEIPTETIVTFESDELILEHGSLSVLTFHSLRVKVRCLRAVPAHNEETLYTVTDQTGRVTVAAIRNDVNIENSSKRPKSVKDSVRSEQVTVRQGEQKSRDEKCGAALPPNGGAAPAALGAILNSPYAVGVAASGVGAICWFICRGSEGAASPAVP